MSLKSPLSNVRSAAVAAVCGALLAGLSPTAANALEAVSVRLKWVAQTQFAGFYVAKAKGFYESEGLDVTINPGGPNLNGGTLVATGSDDFALSGSIENLLSSRAKGLPLTGIAMLLQTTPSAYVAHADSGINGPADFKGKTVSTFFTGAQNILFGVLSEQGLMEGEVNVVPQAVTMAPFIDRQVDVATVMVYNELNVLKKRGVNDIKVFYPHDYGVNFPSDPIITNTKTIEERPDVVQAFLNGSLRGWKYAIENPDEAVEIVMQAASGLEPEHQKSMLIAYGEIMKAGVAPEKGLGEMHLPDLNEARDLLIKREVIDNSLTVEDVIDASFLAKVPAEFREIKN